MEKLSLKIANYYVKSTTLQKGTTIKIEKATSKTEVAFFDIIEILYLVVGVIWYIVPKNNKKGVQQWQDKNTIICLMN